MLPLRNVWGKTSCVRDGIFYSATYTVEVVALKSAVRNEFGVYYTFLDNEGNNVEMMVYDNITTYYHPASFRPARQIDDVTGRDSSVLLNPR
jgi:hypothetical protein